MMPELPAIPDFPMVTWSYQNGYYCLTESDTDLVLNYLENEIPTYQFGINQYEQQMQILLDRLQTNLN